MRPKKAIKKLWYWWRFTFTLVQFTEHDNRITSFKVTYESYPEG